MSRLLTVPAFVTPGQRTRRRSNDVAAAYDAVSGKPLRQAWLDKQRERWAGCCIGLPLTGGNVDSDVFAQVLSGA